MQVATNSFKKSGKASARKEHIIWELQNIRNLSDNRNKGMAGSVLDRRSNVGKGRGESIQKEIRCHHTEGRDESGSK